MGLRRGERAWGLEWVNKQRRIRGGQGGRAVPLPLEVISLGTQPLNPTTSSEAAMPASPQDSLSSPTLPQTTTPSAGPASSGY